MKYGISQIVPAAAALLLCACSGSPQERSSPDLSCTTTAAETATSAPAQTTALTTASQTAASQTAASTAALSPVTTAPYKLTAPPKMTVPTLENTTFSLRAFTAPSITTTTAAADSPLQIWTDQDAKGKTKIRCKVRYHSPIRDQVIDIYSACYLEYYEWLCKQPRENYPYTVAEKYEYYLRDPGSIEITRAIAQSILDGELFADRTDYEKVCEAIAYVQAYPYAKDTDTVGQSEYWRYPLETLFSGGADCEDTSLLLAGILHEMGFDTCFLYINRDTFGHMAIGIRTTDTENASFEIYGNSYYYIETTGTGWRMGEIPEEMRGQMTVILPEW